MLEWVIEPLNGKKMEFGYFCTNMNLWMGLPVFFKKGNYNNFLPIYCHT